MWFFFPRFSGHGAVSRLAFTLPASWQAAAGPTHFWRGLDSSGSSNTVCPPFSFLPLEFLDFSSPSRPFPPALRLQLCALNSRFQVQTSSSLICSSAPQLFVASSKVSASIFLSLRTNRLKFLSKYMFLSHAYAASHCSLLTPSATILPSLLLASPTKVQGPVTCRGLSCSLGSHFRRHRGLGFLSQLLHPSRFHRKGVRTSLLPAPASPFCPCASMSPWSLPSLTGFREGGGINACVKYV